jgi:hypothetical protein
LEKHLDGLPDERFVVHDQYVSLLASAFVHHRHKSAISVPVLLFFYRLAWASAIAFGHVAVSRFGKTNAPPTGSSGILQRSLSAIASATAEDAKPANPFPQKGTKGTKFENRLLRLLLLSCSLHRAKLAP